MNIKQLIITTLSHKLLVLILSICIIASVLLLVILLPPGVDDGRSQDLYNQIKTARYWHPGDISQIDEAKLIADIDMEQERGLKLCNKFLRCYPDSAKKLLVKLYQIDFLWALGHQEKMLKRMEDFLRKHPKKWRKVAYVKMLLSEETKRRLIKKADTISSLRKFMCAQGWVKKAMR